MRQCNTIDEHVQLAYGLLNTISSYGMAAFWSLLVKHVYKNDGNSRVQLKLMNSLTQFYAIHWKVCTNLMAEMLRQLQSAW
jgi:hypothetical protein